MTLMTLGWHDQLAGALAALADPDPDLVPARVAVEHRGSYLALAADGERRLTLAGRLRHAAATRLDLPAVGDWVAARGDVIEHVLPRRSAFVRQAAGARTDAQVVAANIDLAFVVTSPNEDFSPRRVERYAIAIWDAGATPVVVLNKADLCGDGALAPLLDELAAAAPGCAVVAASALAGDGVDALRAALRPGATAVLVGSSGVGKSTLINAVLGRDQQATAAIRASDGTGRHTTTHRELIPIPDTGACLIDTPGMRELQLWTDGDAGMAAAFDDVEALAAQCRFRDCGHGDEPGCAVRDGVDEDRLAAYFKLQRERAHQDRRQDAAARREQRVQGKRRAAEVRLRLRLKGK